MEVRAEILRQEKRGSDDLERCIKIGQQILRLLDKGSHRVEIYRVGGRDHIRAVTFDEA